MSSLYLPENAIPNEIRESVATSMDELGFFISEGSSDQTKMQCNARNPKKYEGANAKHLAKSHKKDKKTTAGNKNDHMGPKGQNKRRKEKEEHEGRDDKKRKTKNTANEGDDGTDHRKKCDDGKKGKGNERERKGKHDKKSDRRRSHEKGRK